MQSQGLPVRCCLHGGENCNTTDPRKLYMQAAFARMVAAARKCANTLQTA